MKFNDFQSESPTIIHGVKMAKMTEKIFLLQINVI
jgi:hypothetical protein